MGTHAQKAAPHLRLAGLGLRACSSTEGLPRRRRCFLEGRALSSLSAGESGSSSGWLSSPERGLSLSSLGAGCRGGMGLRPLPWAAGLGCQQASDRSSVPSEARPIPVNAVPALTRLAGAGVAGLGSCDHIKTAQICARRPSCLRCLSRRRRCTQLCNWPQRGLRYCCFGVRGSLGLPTPCLPVGRDLCCTTCCADRPLCSAGADLSCVAPATCSLLQASHADG